jgi:hypothetical protein
VARPQIIVDELISSRRQGRHIQMPRNVRVREDEAGMKRTPMGGFGKKIYAWPVVGGTEVAGMHAKYTVLLWSTGEISCDCPGWIMYHKRKGMLACKHVKTYDESRQVIFQMWQRHEPLPTAEQARDAGVEVTDAFNPTAPVTRRTNSNLLLGRVIDMD